MPKYGSTYHKQNYKQLAVVLKKEEAAQVEAAAAAAGMTKSAYIKEGSF